MHARRANGSASRVDSPHARRSSARHTSSSSGNGSSSKRSSSIEGKVPSLRLVDREAREAYHPKARTTGDGSSRKSSYMPNGDASFSKPAAGTGRSRTQGNPRSAHSNAHPRERAKASASYRDPASAQRARLNGGKSSVGTSKAGGKGRRAAFIAGICALALLIIFAVDSFSTSNRIYDGIRVGSVDVSGMTIDEAAGAIDNAYLDSLYANNVHIFASQEAMESSDIAIELLEEDSTAEQRSYDEAIKNKQLWVASADSLQASLPSLELAQKAFEAGRESFLASRLNAAFQGIQIPVQAAFNEELLNKLVLEINSTLGEPVLEYSIAVEDGEAHSVEGHDGYMMDSQDFLDKLNAGLLETTDPMTSFVASIEYTPLAIDASEAQLACDAINAALEQPVSFQIKGTNLEIPREMLGSWIATWVKEDPSKQTGYSLIPVINTGVASHDILKLANSNIVSDEDLQVRMEKRDDEVYVTPIGDIELPDLQASLELLDSGLFSNYIETGEAALIEAIEPIVVQTHRFSGDMTLEEAIDFGIVEEFSTYTTNFINSRSTANRAFNICRAADLLNDSIAKADGGVWSFNDTAGNCGEAEGFKAARVIDSGEYTDGIGGGICQVATTVFNAVYEAGFPVDERHNHTLRVSSYPDGRDAAINFDTLDLRWTNDTPSDVILVTSHDDTSVTASLIGRNPKRRVESEVGDWTEGKKYTTKFVVDTALSPNKSYLKTNGTDGMNIKVVRRVYDSNGDQIMEDTFTSYYSPVNRTIAYGEGSDMEALNAKYAEDESKDSSKGAKKASSSDASSDASKSKKAT